VGYLLSSTNSCSNEAFDGIVFQLANLLGLNVYNRAPGGYEPLPVNKRPCGTLESCKGTLQEVMASFSQLEGQYIVRAPLLTINDVGNEFKSRKGIRFVKQIFRKIFRKSNRRRRRRRRRREQIASQRTAKATGGKKDLQPRAERG